MADSRLPLALAVAAAVLVAPQPLRAQTPSPARKVAAPHITVELISASPTLGADEIRLGLRFILEPGWHVYWQNPGDSGGPPTILWSPTAGLLPGDFEWPIPERIPYGQLVNYGYHGEVVLPFRVSVGKGTSAGTLEGRANWLICKELCVQGKARLAIAFPLSGDAAAAVPAWKQMIRDATSKVPRPAPSAWRIEATEQGNEIVVNVRTGRRETGGTFFPADAGIIDDAALQQATPVDGGIRFTLKKSDLLTSTPNSLRGVVALAAGPAHVVAVPVGAATPAKGKTP